MSTLALIGAARTHSVENNQLVVKLSAVSIIGLRNEMGPERNSLPPLNEALASTLTLLDRLASTASGSGYQFTSRTAFGARHASRSPNCRAFSLPVVALDATQRPPPSSASIPDADRSDSSPVTRKCFRTRKDKSGPSPGSILPFQEISPVVSFLEPRHSSGTHLRHLARWQA